MDTVLNKPSDLVHHVKVDQGANWIMLKLNRTLQLRLETLVEKRQIDHLTDAEAAELEAIQELATIFTYLNHQIAHQHRNQLR